MAAVTATRRGNRVRREDGYAIPVVMGVIALLTVITMAGFFMARQSLNESELNRRESQAFQAANGAADAAVARLRLSGYRESDFPMFFPKIGSGEASVTMTPLLPNEYKLVSVGRGADGTIETVQCGVFEMRLYGMNIAYGSAAGFNQNTGGMFNGNASVYGPFYTYNNLRQGENLGTSLSGGFGWGPIYIKGGTLDVKAGYLRDVGYLFVDPEQPDPKVVASSTTVVRAVPPLEVPEVDAAFLTKAYQEARGQSADNVQGDPLVSVVKNAEPTPYPATLLAPGASGSFYKVVDNDSTVNGGYSAGLTIGTGASFGRSTDDFAWDAVTRVLTVWGTVFIDGPLTLVRDPAIPGHPEIHYVGNGSLIVNGPVVIEESFTPVDPLTVGLPEDGPRNGLANQRFLPGEIVGIATHTTISLQASTTNNDKNPDGPPTHAGAFFADERISFKSKTVVVGSLISRGIDVLNNNNMDLRTSPNLGKYIPRSMPGVDMRFVSVGIWARQ